MTAPTLTLSHVVACAQNGVIGACGQLPWHLPEDLKHFKATTLGHAMVMGRKTFESIGRALPGRLTVVVSRRGFAAPAGVVVVGSIDAAMAYCAPLTATWGDEVFVVGGGELYRATLPLAGRLYLTRVHRQVEGETTYPEVPMDQFELVDSQILSTECTCERYERKKAPRPE